MLVTIIADASHCPNTKAAGYACWIASERGKYFHSARMLKPCESSVIAEMMALVNGVYIGLRQGLIMEGDRLCLQTDCIPAIQKLKGSALPSSSGDVIVVKHFKKMLEKFHLQPFFKHVKGHSCIKDGRSHVNRRCDERARHHMQRMRRTLTIKALRETL